MGIAARSLGGLILRRNPGDRRSREAARRDAGNLDRLRVLVWRVLVICECALKGRRKRPVASVLNETAASLESGDRCWELEGDSDVSE